MIHSLRALAILMVVVLPCGNARKDFSWTHDMLASYERRLSSTAGSPEQRVMDVLVHLFSHSSARIPTAFSDNVSRQCKEDSLLYAEQVALQPTAPSTDSWALKSKI